MSFDTNEIEKISPDYWRNSYFSIAEYYGGCTINRTRYVLCPDTDYLIREDIWKKEFKDKKVRDRIAKAEKAKWTKLQQGELL